MTYYLCRKHTIYIFGLTYYLCRSHAIKQYGRYFNNVLIRFIDIKYNIGSIKTLNTILNDTLKSKDYLLKRITVDLIKKLNEFKNVD